MSTFTVLNDTDGHITFYMYPAEQYDSAPGAPTENDIYYNTTDGVLYIYINSAWAALSDTEYFSIIESKTDTLSEGYLDVTRLLILKIKIRRAWWECLQDRDCSHDDKFKDLETLRVRIEGAQADFYGQMQPSARKTVYQLTSEYCKAPYC
jgi:hypothetical protein